MFSEPEHVGELQILIEQLNQNIHDLRSKAKGYAEHGKLYGTKLSEYFSPFLKENNGRLEGYLAKEPVHTFAGWSNDRWQSWAVGSAKEEAVIRIGDLIEPRSNGNFHIPAYIPFIGQGKSIIISCVVF